MAESEGRERAPAPESGCLAWGTIFGPLLAPGRWISQNHRMYCLQCGVHFSGLDGKGSCPYCGKAGEPTGESARPLEAPLPGGESQSVKMDPDRTRTEAESVEHWLAGSVIAGKYEVLSRLGSGGFGTVYKVRHVFRKKYYALKTPHAEFMKDEVFRTRFEREIEAMERFVHPDAVMIRDSGVTEDGRPYYTMDFIEGESLKVVLQREGRLPVERAVRVVHRVLRVLDVAHSHDIIHRDIKPDNILLARSGGREAVKVLDFGVAKLLDLVGDTGSITHGQRVGTPKYMSPEQITGEPVDARSDIFSLGIMFYEMVTGKHPFAQVRDPIRITAAILNKEAVPPREVVPELPRALNELILSMIEKKVKRRPASASALLKQLDSLTLEATRVETVDRIQVHPGVPRCPAESLVLCQETSAGERRCFLIFQERVSFGRSNDPGSGIVNHLLLRCLPCGSKTRDAENWQKNLTISHAVGSMYPDGTALVLEPVSASAHGIVIGGVKSHRPARLQADRFALSLGDRALDLDGYTFLRSSDVQDMDLSFLDHGRPPGLEPPQLTGYSNRACCIDSVSFFRTNNWPLHEYYLVYRLLKIGSSASVALRLRGQGVEEAHAAVVFEGGESFLLALEEGVQVVGCPGTKARPGDTAARGSVELRPHLLLPLHAGMEIIIGDNHLFVEVATDSHYKST